MLVIVGHLACWLVSLSLVSWSVGVVVVRWLIIWCERVVVGVVCLSVCYLAESAHTVLSNVLKKSECHVMSCHGVGRHAVV